MHYFLSMGILRFRTELEGISHTNITISILILYQEKAITCHTKKHFQLEIFQLEIYYWNDLVIQCLRLFIGCLIEESE